MSKKKEKPWSPQKLLKQMTALIPPEPLEQSFDPMQFQKPEKSTPVDRKKEPLRKPERPGNRKYSPLLLNTPSIIPQWNPSEVPHPTMSIIPPMLPLEIRVSNQLQKSVERQSQLMLNKLQRQTKKYRGVGDVPHWLAVPEYLEKLVRHLREEVEELNKEIIQLQAVTVRMEIPSDALMDRIDEESADVCNLALMVRERAQLVRQQMAESLKNNSSVE
jgi:hypothetical protein